MPDRIIYGESPFRAQLRAKLSEWKRAGEVKAFTGHQLAEAVGRTMNQHVRGDLKQFCKERLIFEYSYYTGHGVAKAYTFYAPADDQLHVEAF